MSQRHPARQRRLALSRSDLRWPSTCDGCCLSSARSRLTSSSRPRRWPSGPAAARRTGRPNELAPGSWASGRPRWKSSMRASASSYVNPVRIRHSGERDRPPLRKKYPSAARRMSLTTESTTVPSHSPSRGGQVKQQQSVAEEDVILRHAAHSFPPIGVEGEGEPPCPRRPVSKP